MQPIESVVDRDHLLKALAAAFPPLSPVEQEIGRSLYAELWQGHPVYRERLAMLTRQSTRDVVTALEAERLAPLLLYDRRRRIVGFAGLSIEETSFAITVGGQTLYAWCAWDALFIPEMLGAASAHVVSSCPTTTQLISLTVTARGVTSTEGEPVMSFVVPNASECAASTELSISCFCSEVSFFASYEAGSTWVVQRNGAFLISLAEAFGLGQRHNAARFGSGIGNGSTHR